MAGALRKTMIYLGLADGDYDVRAFETRAGRERRVDAVKLRLR